MKATVPNHRLVSQDGTAATGSTGQPSTNSAQRRSAHLRARLSDGSRGESLHIELAAVARLDGFVVSRVSKPCSGVN